MNIALCCADPTLLERWEKNLASSYTVYQATRLQDLEILLKDVIFECLLIHSTIVDYANIAKIRQHLPSCKLFLLSDRPDEEEGLTFLKQGVVGYANAYISPERLQEATRIISSGAVWVNQKLMQRLIRETLPPVPSQQTNGKSQQAKSALDNLSNREYQVAQLVAEGRPNQEIAKQLGITERTVKAHLSTIYTKTATRGRLNLALLVNK